MNVQTYNGPNGQIEVDVDKVDIDELRTRLKDAEVSFHGRTGIVKLVGLAIENDISVETEEPAKTGNVIDKGYREKYGRDQNCGDQVVAAFKAAVGEGSEDQRDTELRKVADQNGIDYDRWSHLNIGMRRMNLGNVLRGMINRGEAVTIGGQTWEAREVDDEETATAM